MTEASPEGAPTPTMGQLVEEVFADPNTFQTNDFGSKILGTGTAEWSRFVHLGGWDDLIDQQHHWGGNLVLRQRHCAKYVLGRVRRETNTYSLSYSYCTDGEGRDGKTLFSHRVDPQELATDDNEVATFLRAHLRWRQEQPQTQA